jgi:hypothetical protein
MTVREFLAVAYALLVEEYQRIGTDLLTAIEKVDASLGLREAPAGVPVTASVAGNDAALAELQQMMGGRNKR